MKSKRPSLPMAGGCQCGVIRYEITSLPLLLHTCNCTDCQRQSGSAFALNMPVRSADFRILQGEPNGWHHTSPNGTPVVSRFCGNCGRGFMASATAVLKPSAFAPARWMTRHGWCRSRIFLRAARSRGCNRRAARSALKPSRTAGEACCRRGVPAGRILPIEWLRDLSPPILRSRPDRTRCGCNSLAR
jgi:hypothetical protein